MAKIMRVRRKEGIAFEEIGRSVFIPEGMTGTVMGVNKTEGIEYDYVPFDDEITVRWDHAFHSDRPTTGERKNSIGPWVEHMLGASGISFVEIAESADEPA